MYQIAGDKAFYGDTVSADSFSRAVELARTICRVAGTTLVGVMPCEIVSEDCPCAFRVF